MPSLLNGLSSAGAGLADYASKYGAEAQKGDIQSSLLQQRSALELQQVVLANQLAASRESTGRSEAAGYASAAAEKQQAFELAKQREQASLLANAPTEAQKNILFYQKMGWIPGGAPDNTASPTPTGSQPSNGGGSGGGFIDAGTWDGSAPSPMDKGTSTPSPSTQNGAAAPNPALNNPLVRSALGMPKLGSEEDVRSTILQGIRSDPATKDLPSDQQAAILEEKLAIAKNTLAKPETRDALAQAIADYQLSPLDQRARQMAGGPETMKKVMELNPDYQEGMYPAINKLMVDFSSGKEGNTIRSANVGVQHLDVMSDAANALKNKNFTAFNTIMNATKQQFGVSAPNTFEGLKQIVATEIEKAVAGGIGSKEDRDRLMNSLASKNSPDQLQDMLEGFRSLMAGQVMGLKKQYEAGTPENPRFRENGPFSFDRKLMPATVKALKLGHTGDSGPSTGTDETSTLAGPAVPSNLPPPPQGFRIIQ